MTVKLAWEESCRVTECPMPVVTPDEQYRPETYRAMSWTAACDLGLHLED